MNKNRFQNSYWKESVVFSHQYRQTQVQLGNRLQGME